MAVALSWSMIILIIYAASYAVIVLTLGIIVYRNRINKDITYCEELVYQREIYTAVIVHIYDQSTDLAVMVNWGRLTVRELNGDNVEGINMLSFLILGIFVMFLYRFITVCFALFGEGRATKDSQIYHYRGSNVEKKSLRSTSFDIFLAIFDLYFVKVIYQEFVKGEAKPNVTHRSLQLCESLFESMPQVVLQSVFLLRYSIAGESDFFSLILTILSIIASLLSIANKYSWFDEQACVQAAREIFCGKMHRFPVENQKIPFSWKFIVRSVWRWSDLCVRFVIFSLLWVSIGGFWFIVYIVISFVYYFAVVRNRIKGAFWYRILATIICEVGVILDYEPHFCIIRCLDNGILLIIVSSLILSNYQCQLGITIICSDDLNRNIQETPMFLVFLLLGWIGYGLELLLYPILQSHKLGIIKKSLAGREFFNIILHGADAVPTYFLTFYIETNDGCTYQEITNFNTKKSMEDCNKLAEDLEDIFCPGDIAGDIAVNYKVCKPFKYGISMEVMQNIYDDNNLILTGDTAIQLIKKLYDADGEYMEQIIQLFKQHFDVEKTRYFKVKCTEQIFGFLVLNAEAKDKGNGVVEKYRFGEEIKTHSVDCRIIRGHDFEDLYNKKKQVLIKVIDRMGMDTFNNDLFHREITNLRILNESKGDIRGILPFKGSDKADDAFFVVTKALNGETFLDYITKKALTMKNVMNHIVEMFAIVNYLHSKDIVHRNITLESFQFMDKEKDPELILTNYEYSKKISDSDEPKYGNISGKLLYLSPELCGEVRERVMTLKKWRGRIISGEMYKKSDCWAMGILCYFLITGKRLFAKSAQNKLKTIYKIISFEGIKPNLEPFTHQKSNELFVDFMNKILATDYKQRMNISDCLNHGFLSAEHINDMEEDLMMKNDILLNQLTYKTSSLLHAAILKVQVSDLIEREETENMMARRTESQFLDFCDHKDYVSMAEQFHRMDLDNDGYTTLEELTTLLTSLGYSTHYAVKQSKVIMEELDENGDGVIEFKEFAKSWLQHKLDSNDKYIHAIFEVFDVNKDGVISIDELRNGLFKNKEKEEEDDIIDIEYDVKQIQDADTLFFEESKEVEHEYDSLEQMLDEIDEDGDGEISFDEFYKAMSSDLNKKNESHLFNTIIKDINFMLINEFGKDPLFENEKDYEKHHILSKKESTDHNHQSVPIVIGMESSLKNTDKLLTKVPSVEN